MRREGVLRALRFACPDLVGRDEELSLLGRLVSAAASGSAAAVLIAGDAGLGKSALLRRAAEMATREGLRVLRADSVRLEMRRPFGPFVDAFASLAERHPLVRAALDLGPAAVPGAPVSELDRYRTHAAFTRAVHELAEERPLFLAIDDLHWADDASLELLAYLTQRVSKRVLVLGTYRPEEVRERPALRRALNEVARERRWDVELRPLTSTEAGRALRLILGPARMSASTRELLHARSGGSPLFLEEILRALASRGDLQRGEGGWRLRDPHSVPLPASVRDAVRERFRALDEASREIISVAAVIGERFGYDLLREASGKGEADMDAALRRGLDAQLIVEHEPGTFGFRHALTRDAVLAEMLSRDREAAHRRVAEILERGADPDALAAIASHWDSAGVADRASAAHERAGEHALQRSAFADALRHLIRAVGLASEDDARIARLQFDVGRFAFLLHRIPISLAAARDAVRRYERLGDRRGVARVLPLEDAAAMLLGGTSRETADRIRRIFDVLASEPEAPELAWAFGLRSWSSLMDGDLASARADAEHSLEIAQRVDTARAEGGFDFARYAHVYAMDRLADVRIASDDPEDAIRLEREAVRIADAQRYEDFSSGARYTLAFALRVAGEREQADRTAQEARDRRQRHGALNDFMERLNRLLWEPDWDEFLRVYDDEEAETMAWARLAIRRCLILVAREGPRHVAALDRPRQRLLAAGGPARMEGACAPSAEVLLLAGEPRQALDALEPALPYFARLNPLVLAPTAGGFPAAVICGLLGARQAGDADALRRWSGALEPLVLGRWALSVAAVDQALRYVAVERALESDRSAAIDLLVALQRERHSGPAGRNTITTALLSERLISILLPANEAHDRVLATEELAQAVAFWRRAGATWYLGRLRERADQWGLAFPEEAVSGIARRVGLTARENEVARLVAEGLTNKDIAERLTLSVRTAESHVERIRSKLGFHTRAQIASWATETYGPPT